MGIAPRIPTSWASLKVERALRRPRYPTGSLAVTFAVGTCLFYLILLLVLQFFLRNFTNEKLSSRQQLETDGFLHFQGSRECGITEADIYLAPWRADAKTSPFCKNRVTLLEAMIGGDRQGFDKPYIGKGCTYKWFSTPEICMILERFNSIVFIGDDIAESTYAAFNMLLREYLAFGAIIQWSMTAEERVNCKCDNQFLNSTCREQFLKDMEEVESYEGNTGGGRRYFCQRISHAFIPLDNVPMSVGVQDSFRDRIDMKSNAWQPTKAMAELGTLATSAERNIPMLFLGPAAFGSNGTTASPFEDGNVGLQQYIEQIETIANSKQFELLSTYNLTLQASSMDGEHFGIGVALVQAMMIINWLSKVETS